MVSVKPSGSKQVTSVSAKSSNQVSTVDVESKNESNIVKGTNDLAEYYANVAKQYAEKAVVDVNSVIDNILNNAVGTGNIEVEYNDKLLVIKDRQFKHEQAVASTDWIINHNLGKRPSAVIVDSAGNQFRPAISHIDDNNCILSMLGATTGTAYLN